MFFLHICHKRIELLSLIESDSLLTLIYVLVDNVSCYEYPAGMEHSVRVKMQPIIFTLCLTPGPIPVTVSRSQGCAVFSFLLPLRGSSAAVQAPGTRDSPEGPVPLLQLQQVGTGSS